MIGYTRFALLLAAVVSASPPSPQSLKSDLTLIVDNDLQGPSSPSADSAVIVLSARSLKDAKSACEALGEELWSPEKYTTADIQTNLNFSSYNGGAISPQQQYWVAPQGSTGRCIGQSGHVSSSNPSQELPVLCTQSAPFSNSTGADSSEKWQVTVQSNNEYLTGYRDHNSFRFLGIRYAEQPERFTYSTPYKGSGKMVSATDYGSPCVQSGVNGSEDCLFLNVWTNFLPETGSKTSLKPVMFWIHGGAFTSGSNLDPTSDGGNLASRGDVVVVAINYRLTTLGFLALDDGKTKGNYGIADQINALGWVRKNIRDFGGDPDRITIFGQSAGAGSVRALLASPKSIGQFAGAIMESNLGGIQYGTTYSLYYTIEQEMEEAGNAILEATNCTDAASRVDCLRAVPANTLATLSTVARYVVVDGTYITSDQLELYGPTLPAHIMLGVLRDDGAPIAGWPSSSNATAVLEAEGYPIPDPSLFPLPALTNETLAIFNLTSHVSTDGVFRCIDQATIYAGLETGRFNPAGVYYYEFNRTYQTLGWPGLDVCEAPVTPDHPYGDPDAEYFKCHSGELYYVFGNVGRMGLPLRDDHDLPFEQYVLDAWASFARTYDPNPDLGFLQARGYENTILGLRNMGKWVPATKGKMTGRTLQWPNGFQGPFTEGAQCDSLGLGLNYYIK
ncbi:Alpha/Beta hydrolase protein [Xylariales sp. PMI_506]|nr:Alpha/Beta hydrolase protein [Xylariales sp. PMI_506]